MNRQEHGVNGAVRDIKGKKDEGDEGMVNPVLAIGLINWYRCPIFRRCLITLYTVFIERASSSAIFYFFLANASSEFQVHIAFPGDPHHLYSEDELVHEI